MRANASGKTILKYFVEKCNERNYRYYVTIPWDARNLEEQKESYSPQEIADLIDYYFGKKSSGWSVKDFIMQIPDLARARDFDIEARNKFKQLVLETKRRMEEGR